MIKRTKQAAALALACVMALSLLSGCGISQEQQGILNGALGGAVSQDKEEDADSGQADEDSGDALSDKLAQVLARYATDTIGTMMALLAGNCSETSVPSYALAILEKYPDDASENADMLTRTSMEGIAGTLASLIEQAFAQSANSGAAEPQRLACSSSFDSYWALTESELYDLILALDRETEWKDQMNKRIFNGILKAAVSSKIDDETVKAALANASLSLPDAKDVTKSGCKVEYLGNETWVLYLNFTLASVAMTGSFGSV